MKEYINAKSVFIFGCVDIKLLRITADGLPLLNKEIATTLMRFFMDRKLDKDE